MPVIAAGHLSKVYANGAVALQDLSLDVEAGERVAVIGPSGSGKTTFFRLVNATLRPSGGALAVLGKDLSAVRGRALDHFRRDVAMVYQGHNLVPSLTAYQNVRHGRLGRDGVPGGLRAALWPASEQRREVWRLLADLDIEEKLYTRVDDLSGGQQQRVAIARALFQQPRLLLADEPIASVDAETAVTILSLLESWATAGDRALVVSLHQHQYVDRFFTRVIELQRGRLVRDEVLAPHPLPA